FKKNVIFKFYLGTNIRTNELEYGEEYMKVNNMTIINEYKNYLIKTKENSTDLNKNIKSIRDINDYKIEAKQELEKLKELSAEYKLYDKNYEEFRIAMGKLALSISKSFKLKLDDTHKSRLISEFIRLNNEFEDLFQKNIMKDTYVWK
ncbi:MAG: hypothetical protein ACRC92_07430, partial [Peptostreptococcaceae bacterium]